MLGSLLLQNHAVVVIALAQSAAQAGGVCDPATLQVTAAWPGKDTSSDQTTFGLRIVVAKSDPCSSQGSLERSSEQSCGTSAIICRTFYEWSKSQQQ